MRYVTVNNGSADHVGVMVGEHQMLDVTQALGEGFTSMREIIEGGAAAWDAVLAMHSDPPEEHVIGLDTVELRAPLPNPVRIRDCTLFTEHIEPAFRALGRQRAQKADDPEAEYERMLADGECDLPEVLRKQFVYYNADHLSVSGPNELITAPPTSSSLDYELEFAAVLGPGGQDIGDNARDHIFGYVIFNDWSARDVQSEVMKSTLGPAEGKDFEGSNTLGPFLVTADEVGDPYKLAMSARVNGEEWSRGSSASMTHTFEFAIAHLSRGKRLYAGDVLGSGTVVSGCGFELGRRLSHGDVVELEVERLGTLRNTVAYNGA